ncbi:MAG TPA: RNase A-like domain-containing protein [Jatrophihabitans sp.]|nr:RNase A-like domain-containing protein [Jatrophihabitans sp.]
MKLERFELPAEGLPAARLCLAQRVPAGDPALLRAAGRRSGAFAAELRHSADVLLSAAESGLWRGPAHRALVEQLRSHAPALTATAVRYEDYAGALFGYACALDDTAGPLAAARQQLQLRSDELATRQHHAALQAAVALPDSQAALLGPQAALPGSQAALPGQLATGQDPGAELLLIARAFKAGYDQWADALDRCVRALLRADESDPTRDLHGLRAFGHQLNHAVAAAVTPFERAMLHPSLHNISACLGELNVGLSVLGLGLLFIWPPAGAACLAAATVLAVAQLAVDSTRRARGESVRNASLGLELAAAIPLGGNAFRSLRAADDVVHLVPGGGLMAHEGVDDAHTLAKHVGKSDEFLRNRLATEPHITGASTFYDRQAAENSISGLLRMNQRKIDRWLSGSVDELVLRGKLPTPAGVLIARGFNDPVPQHGIKIILRRSAKMENGYLLVTAMVTK